MNKKSLEKTTGLRHNVFTVDSLEFGLIQDEEAIAMGKMDCFDIAEDNKRKIEKNELSKIMKVALMEIVGERNYNVYYMCYNYKIRQQTVATYFNVSLSTVKRICADVKEQLEVLTNKMNDYDRIMSELEVMAHELKLTDRRKKLVVNGESQEFEFDFETLQRQYYENIRDFEKGYGIDSTLDGWE